MSISPIHNLNIQTLISFAFFSSQAMFQSDKTFWLNSYRQYLNSPRTFWRDYDNHLQINPKSDLVEYRY